MADTETTAHLLRPRLDALGRRAAVAAGALAALASLCFHVPPWVASLRGALAFLAVLATARLLQRLFLWTCDASAQGPTANEKRP